MWPLPHALCSVGSVKSCYHMLNSPEADHSPDTHQIPPILYQSYKKEASCFLASGTERYVKIESTMGRDKCREPQRKPLARIYLSAWQSQRTSFKEEEEETRFNDEKSGDQSFEHFPKQCDLICKEKLIDTAQIQVCIELIAARPRWRKAENADNAASVRCLTKGLVI